MVPAESLRTRTPIKHLVVISWGWFQGGFDLDMANENTSTGCERWSQQTVSDASALDYSPHHAPFQYYPTTANPTHARPSSVTAIGSTFQKDGRTLDPANHHYDSHDFFETLQAGNFPALSYLKAPRFCKGKTESRRSDAAGTARVCRCWSSHPSLARTISTTR
jgi:hypothetical protein